MGKKRVAIVGKQPAKKGPTIDRRERKVVKTGKEHGRITDMAAEALAEAEKIKEKERELEKIAVKAPKKAKPHVAKALRGRRYQEARKKVDPNKFYPLVDAIKLLKKVSIANFNASVDVHLVVRKEGLKGTVDFPHPTGKKQVVRLADEKLLSELEKGEINFTALVATPSMMSGLAKYAKLLGPRGLMPNPKAGTITDKPEELVKKLSGKAQSTSWRTEAKAPLIHLAIGKVDSSEKQLEENFHALITSVGRKNIKKAVLAPTMGPGIKINLTTV